MAMTIGTMFGDILRSLFRRPATRRYPDERKATPPRLRGQLFFDPESCVGCGLCCKECPADAIELITLDKKAKRFVVRYDAGKCTYCGQCVVSCRFNCLTMPSTQWELAGFEKENFVHMYGREEDILEALQRGADADDAGDGNGV